ncbi:MAG: hypothetical protein H5U13_11480 [Parvibaculum sp.]|nr:hypothetical protein [Parvibaculum sp.]
MADMNLEDRWAADSAYRAARHRRAEDREDRQRLAAAVEKRRKRATTTADTLVSEFLVRAEAMRRALVLAAAHAAPGVHKVELEMFGSINAETEIEFVGAIVANPAAAEIEIRIDSRGGLCEHSEAVALAIAAHPAARKVAIIVGECASAACLVALACPERLADAFATFQPHATYIQRPDGNRKPPEELTPDDRAACEAADKIEILFAEARRIPPTVYKNLLAADAPLDSAFGIEAGFFTGTWNGERRAERAAPRAVAVAESDVGIPDFYEIETVTGEVALIPMNKALVANMAKAMQRRESFSCFDLPSQIFDAAADLAGLAHG